MRGILWEDTSAEPPFGGEPLTGTASCSVAVIGGGIGGLSAGLHLAEQGISCRVLEAEAVGAGASGRNNGQVIPGLKLGPDDLERRYGNAGAAVIDTAGGAADLVFDLIERHGIACEAERRGWVRAAHAAAAMPPIEKLARQWQGRGAQVEPLDREAVRDALGSESYVGGLIDRRAGRLQPLAYCRGLARAAAKAGAGVHENSPVAAVTRRGGAWEISTAGGVLTAERIVVATGVYDTRLWPAWARGFLPVYAMQIASEPLTSNLRGSVLPGASAMSDTRKLANALRLDAEGRIVISGRGPLSGRMTQGVRRQLVRAVTRLFPDLGPQQWSHFWSGRIGVTLDELPRLTSLAPGVYAMAGFNGRGIAMATALGKAAARHAAGLEAGFPLVEARPVPFHGLRKPMLGAAVSYYRVRDALGLASR